MNGENLDSAANSIAKPVEEAIGTLLASGRDGNPLSRVDFMSRVAFLPRELRGDILASPKVHDFVRDTLVLVPNKDGKPLDRVTFIGRIDALPIELRRPVVTSLQTYTFVRDSLVLGDSKEGGRPSAATVAERIRFMPPELREDMSTDPLVKSEFPNLEVYPK